MLVKFIFLMAMPVLAVKRNQKSIAKNLRNLKKSSGKKNSHKGGDKTSSFKWGKKGKKGENEKIYTEFALNTEDQWSDCK